MTDETTKPVPSPTPVEIQPETITLFLHLPIHIAKQLLDRVEAGVSSTPSSALLEALHNGLFIGSGPNPINEIEAVLSRIESRVLDPERLAIIRSKLGEVAVSAQQKLEEQNVVLNRRLQETETKLAQKEVEFSQAKMVIDRLMSSVEQLATQKKASAQKGASGSEPKTWAAMNKDQQIVWIKFVIERPKGERALRNWMNTTGLQFREFDGETKTLINEIQSVLGKRPQSSRDERVREIRSILDEIEEKK